MSAVLPKVDTLSICEICKNTWRVSLSIGVRITMIRCVVYLLCIFKMFHGHMNNPVFGSTAPSGASSFARFLDHAQRQSTVGSTPWTSDQPVAETSDNTQHSQQTSIT